MINHDYNIYSSEETLGIIVLAFFCFGLLVAGVTFIYSNDAGIAIFSFALAIVWGLMLHGSFRKNQSRCLCITPDRLIIKEFGNVSQEIKLTEIRSIAMLAGRYSFQFRSPEKVVAAIIQSSNHKAIKIPGNAPEFSDIIDTLRQILPDCVWKDELD